MNQPKPSYRDLKRAIENAAALLRVRETQVNYLINEVRKLKPDHDIFTKTVRDVLDLEKGEKPVTAQPSTLSLVKGGKNEDEVVPMRSPDASDVRGQDNAGERGGKSGGLPAPDEA